MQNYRDYKEKGMSMPKLIKEIYSSKGLMGFYGGFFVNLLRILPNTAIMFVSYEYLSKVFSKMEIFNNKL